MLGIDAGSRFVKIVWSLQNSIDTGIAGDFSTATIDTAEFYREWVIRDASGLKIHSEKLMELTGRMSFEITGITGYGRNVLDFSGGSVVNEIKAHAYGASILSHETEFLLLDIGGQDTKVALVQNGRPVDFVTNDKCAAGCGRYLEHMASILGVDVETLSMAVDSPVYLSSTCAIFAESEVIGMMASGHSISAIMAGVNSSAAERIFPLLEPFLSSTEKIFLSGGGGMNSGLSHFLGKLCGKEPLLLENAQFCGAMGAMEIARKKAVILK
jgi:predicted CoA-substrate-specific enzyme activase